MAALCTGRMPKVVEDFAKTRAHIDGAAHDDAPGVVRLIGINEKLQEIP